ncbi:uncharacterized protein CHSO_4357 [Chryseobacterium sp. StRB126]|uniref:hypothetical protein n=1 Tax=Chryseobacterium sp. StRB126 TaxID=878220 RepID=UPI0004E994A1|nr:hypothetical protein [Chryseobacterium sp. StRB126]BAP33394.1 uncharacterized protein CHSO_4357 [Chryseobacterium sp. StRB126]
MLIENKGITTSSFYIPPFKLNAGEFVVLFLYNGQHFHETKTFLKDIFSGRTKNESAVINKNMTYAEHYKESAFRQLFYPQTVGKYLKKNANLNSLYARKIYEIKGINENTKIKTLSANSTLLLSLYTTLSNTDTIMLDLQGQGPIEAKEIYKIINEFVKNGGSALLCEGYNDLKNECTKYIELQWNQ